MECLLIFNTCICLAALQGIAREWGEKKKIKPFWLIRLLLPSLQDHMFKYILWRTETPRRHGGFVPCTWIAVCQQFWIDFLEGLGSLMFYLRVMHLRHYSHMTDVWPTPLKFCENKFRLRSWAGENLQTRIAMRFAFRSLPRVVCFSLKVSTKVSCIWEHQVTVVSLSPLWMRTCYDRQLCKHSMK